MGKEVILNNLKVKLTAFVTLLCLMTGVNAYALEVAYMDYRPAGQIAISEERDTFVIVDSFKPVKPEAVPVLQPQEDTFNKPLLSMKVPDSTELPPVSLRQPEKRSSEETVSTVYFKFDSYSLTREQKIKLNRIIPELKDKSAAVYGYTCTIGTKKYNKVLSQKRAHAVSTYLKKRGVRVEKEIGMGETTASRDKRLNRKAVIKAVNKGGE